MSVVIRQMNIETSYNRMKALGFDPRRILDVGAYKGEWSLQAKRFFPNATFTLVEANNHTEPHSIGRAIYAVLSDTQKIVPWYSIGGTGDSTMKELTGHYAAVNPVYRHATTLDDVFPTDTFDFIKIDCQGAEIDILKGGSKLVSSCSAILLECPFACQYNTGSPTFAGYIAYLDEIGFIPFEVTEVHCSKVIFQIDILFVRKTDPLAQYAQTIIHQMGL
jgi:FkbM family methyltransferase